MSAGGTPSWVIRENASRPVLLALYLREVLGIASPVELPRLRDVGAVGDRLEIDRHDLLERQWRAWWAMTVEPEAHPSPVPLELVDAYDTDVALPVSERRGARGRDRAARRGRAGVGRVGARGLPQRHRPRAAATRTAPTPARSPSTSARSAAARTRSSSTSRCVPFAAVGVWWIGAMSVAVTDSLRSDASAFDDAIHPIIAELA